MIVSTLQNLTTNVIIELGEAFSYKPYIRKKRIVVKPSNKAVFIYKTDPLFVDGMETFAVDFGILTHCEMEIIKDAYDSGDRFLFNGHYAEEYIIEFEEFMLKRVGNYWRVTGVFRVLCVTDDFKPTDALECECD